MPAKFEEITLTYHWEKARFGNGDSDSVAILECDLVPQPDSDAFANLEPLQRVTVKVPCGPADFTVGLDYRLYGRWTEHPKYGRQFVAKTFVRVQPHGRVGTIRYLMLAPWIGQVTATTLWDKFGGQAIQVLRATPAIAVAATGMNAARADEACRYLVEQEALEDVTVDLVDLFAGRGFPKDLAIRTIKEWGNKAAELIRRNPYLLMGFRGCGFLLTDQLYLDLGGDPARLKRQALCAWHAIASDTDGHTWHPPRIVEKGLRERLAGTAVRPVDAVRLAKRARMLDVKRDDKGVWLADASKAQHEATIAERVRTWLSELPGELAMIYETLDWCPGYRIGSDGSVWSCRSNSGGIHKDKWKQLSADEIKGGYLRVTLRVKNGVYERWQVSHLVLNAFVGPSPDDWVCCHGDGNPKNNTLRNLRWDTRRENEEDKKAHGTHQTGEGNPAAKLTEDAVRKIRHLRATTDASLNDLARRFSVAKKTIVDIVQRRNWRHVT